jgi:protein transport protein SEC61 subunit gamma-like protein
MGKIRDYLSNCKRVLIVTKKPTSEEVTEALKICAIGTVLVGVIGFIIYVISILFLG